jgi:acyl carrier protein
LLNGLPEVRKLLEGEPGTDGESTLVSRLAGMTETEQRRTLSELVRNQVADLLGYDDPANLEPGRAFEDLGFDSVAAVDLRIRLSSATGRKLPATMAFDYATPAALAEFLRSELCQDGGAQPMLAELDKFEEAVAALTADELESTRMTVRLQTLLARLNETLGAGGGADVGDQLESASADDVFDFIDKELGLA